MEKTKLEKTLERAFENSSTPQEVRAKIMEDYEIRSKDQIRMGRYFRLRKSREFVIVYHSAKEKILQLSNAEAGTFYHLITFLQWGKEGTLYRNGRKMQLNVISEITGISNRRLREMINRFVECDLLIKIGGKKNREYVINPTYVEMGKLSEKRPFTRIFKIPGRYLNEKISKKEMGFLFKLYFYIDHNTHILTLNPYEKDSSNVVPLRIREIAEIMGDSIPTVRTYTTRLIEAGFLYQEKEDIPPNMMRYYIYPQIASRGSDVSDCYSNVKAMFPIDLYTKMYYEKDDYKSYGKNGNYKESIRFWTKDIEK